MLLCIAGVSWVMLKSTMELLNSWKGIAEEELVKMGGRLSQLVFNERCGRREIPYVLEAKGPIIRRLKSNALVYFIWCKHDMMGDTIDLVDCIGNLLSFLCTLH
ncbi:hypothetical protein MTR67_035336 [Solanum verrucosum]|uniref:Uncharacterized protein n=1 Tax=Solanum verrucosum TaxID=315347 RepID=A0AAF0UAB2_SOLVR|nr:hypothetical protein MTR67_035336 [Solanum verrucosum]